MKIYSIGKEIVIYEGEPNELADYFFIMQEKSQSAVNKKIDDILSKLFSKGGTS